MAILKFHAIMGKELQIEGEQEVVERLIEKYYAQDERVIADEQNVDNMSITLNDAVYKAKAKIEAEWLLVYAHHMKKAEFNRQDLLTSYRESNRYSLNRSKSLSFNLKLCIKNGWMNAVGKNTYTLSMEGKKRIEEILPVR